MKFPYQIFKMGYTRLFFLKFM